MTVRGYSCGSPSGRTKGLLVAGLGDAGQVPVKLCIEFGVGEEAVRAKQNLRVVLTLQSYG